MGMQPYKQPEKTLAAFCQMRSREAKLVIVGKVNSEFERHLSGAVSADLRRRIELPGVVTAAKLKELLGSARAVAVPSLYQHPVASPTVLEAFASHTPAVVSPSISTLVANHGENCFIESTAEQMARRFEALFGDDTLWDKLSAGCARSKLRFDSLTVAQDYIQLAEELRAR